MNSPTQRHLSLDAHGFDGAPRRIVGALAIAGAFVGIGKVAADDRARHAMVDWLTLGHGEQARGAEVLVRKWAAALSQR